MRDRKHTWVKVLLLTAFLNVTVSAQQSSTVGANPIPLPAIPFIAEYEYAPLYFMQWINDHPQYSAIAATVTKGERALYQVILTERESKRPVYYCSSETRVKALKREGKEAHPAAIDFKIAEGGVGRQPTYGFGFRDKHGQAILWRFIPASRPSEKGAGLTPLAGVPGLRLMYRNVGTTAGEGTAVQIGDRVSEAAPWPEISAPPYFIAYRGSHTVGLDNGALLPGSETWRLTSAPSELREGAEWRLVSGEGRERRLKITSLRADEIIISEAAADTVDAAALTLNARATGQSIALRSVTLTRGPRLMRITFKPELLISPSTAQSSAEVAFQVDLNGHEKIAQGNILVERQAGGTLRMLWQPASPDWARSRPLDNTIRINADGYTLEVSQLSKQAIK